MLNFSDSKSMARTLRKGLAERGIDIGHADGLELVARQFGFANWNMLSARLEDQAEQLVLPHGWIVSGARANLYRMGIDPTLPGAIRIESLDRAGPAEASAFATLMQSIDAADYRGKTVRIEAELRSRSVDSGALWMRIDPGEGGRWLRFDNMHFRKTDGALHGDADWTRRSVVLDVPVESGSIHFGIMLSGGGILSARHFVFEEVDPKAFEVTAERLAPRPTNLGFGRAAN